MHNRNIKTIEPSGVKNPQKTWCLNHLDPQSTCFITMDGTESRDSK